MCTITDKITKNINSMEIKYINDVNSGNIESIDNAFEGVESHNIACNNWANEYPYAPQVSFKMFHNTEFLFLRFDVAESYTMAKVEEDNGEVWTDSCVEFFLALDDTGYYNFEATCIGKMLVAFRKERNNPTDASKEIMNSIKRYASLGDNTFDEITGDNKWSLTLAIPSQTLFNHNIETWAGVEASMNLYKCGDNLSQPHFLSWKPIDNPTPNFHLPAFFETIKFV